MKQIKLFLFYFTKGRKRDKKSPGKMFGHKNIEGVNL
jgi:hypothetical protein